MEQQEQTDSVVTHFQLKRQSTISEVGGIPALGELLRALAIRPYVVTLPLGT